MRNILFNSTRWNYDGIIIYRKDNYTGINNMGVDTGQGDNESRMIITFPQTNSQIYKFCLFIMLVVQINSSLMF